MALLPPFWVHWTTLEDYFLNSNPFMSTKFPAGPLCHLKR